MKSDEEKLYSPEDLKKEFISVYGGSSEEIEIYSSPARINIIGEHIDYNGGKVFPTAIDRYLYIAFRKRNDSKIIYQDLRFPGEFEFSVNEKFVYDKQNDYANYLNGILSQLIEKGFVLPSGFEILIASNIPAGGGISSSSALECGFAYTVCSAFGFDVSRKEIARLGQMSEHNFMNVKCGIMDQFIISCAKKNTAMILDCATLEHEFVPLELGGYRFIVMNSNKMRKLSESRYNERRSECQQALKILNENGIKIDSLCALSVDDWENVKKYIENDVLFRRAKHCVYENRRVLDAAAALRSGNLNMLGKLMNESHASLKNDYETTGFELDVLSETAQKQEGCLGARVTGAGFGGCAIALVHADFIESFEKSVQSVYEKAVGYKAGFFSCESGDGVKRIE